MARDSSGRFAMVDSIQTAVWSVCFGRRMRWHGRARISRVCYGLKTIIDGGMPQPALRQREQRPATTWADPLIVLDVRVGDFVMITQLLFDGDQVLDVHTRGKSLAAATAVGLFTLFTCV